ncbi:hypothetical protein E1292_44655 [Nonomuraea deserti]|uniref:Uncharacterized protein n=1 Tax=Nonomuraea deserti TaxID=1848322 RepID=A0A4R4ULH3_9ACTN|nr:hypothetical protein E1292_44655 [Nonomuraea deserti]
MNMLTRLAALCFLSLAVLLPVTAVSARTVNSPMCPVKGPAGGEYVKTVYQWPPYDVYQVRHKEVRVYCY